MIDQHIRPALTDVAPVNLSLTPLLYMRTIIKLVVFFPFRSTAPKSFPELRHDPRSQTQLVGMLQKLKIQSRQKRYILSGTACSFCKDAKGFSDINT